jgi:hypothetical protein
MGDIETGRKLADLNDGQLPSVMHQHRANLIARLPETQRKAFQSAGSATAISKQ